MREHGGFEARLRDLLLEETRAVDRPFDADVIARRARARPPGWVGSVTRLLSRREPALARVGLLAALAALVAILAAVASQSGPDPAELVRRSRAAHDAPPAFTMTTTAYDLPGDGSHFHACASDHADEEVAASMRLRYAYDGFARFRQACRYELPDGSGVVEAWIVVTPEGEGNWTGLEWHDDAGYGYRAAAPLATVEWLNWADIGPFVPPLAAAPACAWHLEGQEVVAGRTAWIVSCAGHAFWIDAESFLVLKRAHEGTVVSEVLEIDLGEPPAAELFAVAPPSGARRRLQVGQVAADWTLPRLGGGRVSWSDQPGDPTVVLLRGYCGRACMTLATFVRTLEPSLRGLNALVYAAPVSGMRADDPETLVARLGFVGSEIEEADAAGIPIVIDDGDVGGPAWHVEAAGVALFDAAGRLVAQREPLTATSLGAIVDALLTGRPVPGTPAGESLFEPGEPAPPLEAELLEGPRFDLAGNAGSRVAVLLMSAVDETAALTLLAAFAEACAVSLDAPVCLVIPGWQPYSRLADWVELRDRAAAAGHPIDRVAIARSSRGEAYWSSLLHWNLMDPTEGMGDRRAVVIVDEQGLVAAVEVDPQLDGTTLARLVTSP